MAAAGAAAAAEGMEPRALQYEQTLVSRDEPSGAHSGTVAPGYPWKREARGGGGYPNPALAF